MLYILKRFDEPVAMIDFAEDGGVKKFRINPENENLAPIHAQEDHQWLKKWWKRRSAPLEQGRIQQMLQQKGFTGTEEYLVRNLGLSSV